MITYFCPACWNVISQDDIICPYCGYDLRDFQQMPYERKLLMGLNHPVTEMKLNVLHVIGMKNLKEAIPYIENMINKETNPVVLMQIVDTLAMMSHPEALELLHKLTMHRYPTVSSKAKQALKKLLKLRG
ncbi:HEAT repeat-containing protein [Venenivibrio stagnispumantis]|uniref:HEAT repeat-containing protein n=2 Tax=Venenivibrio stagnispumantis TaxID=407998 RepID=A0AA45WME4_9AQUI|nr:zinc ribbon domain-containing protein [Venenivibrio stagnispumantis]SMP14162.1 HEAT repeat-containing protein [Venenivibrio stagnispumantis]